MINGNITRSFYTCYATGYVVDGIGDAGLPNLSEVRSENYITVNPNDKALAKRMCKAANKKVITDTITVIEVSCEVRSMTLDDFYAASTPVERAANGRIS